MGQHDQLKHDVSVFTEKSLGVGPIPVEGLPTQPYRRMDRHQILIVAWLFVSTAVIMVARRRNRYRTIGDEPQVEMLQDSEEAAPSGRTS